MAIDKVKAYFAEFGREGDVMEFPTSSATVELAAQAVGCEPARIAKTLSFAVGDRVALVVYPACGSSNSAIALAPDELAACTPGSTWVDVCKLPEA